VQAFVLAVIILAFVAFVYQGIALSSREPAPAEQTTSVTVPR
jgi:hypothetical protein